MNSPADDPFHLERFVEAQETDYTRALEEIRSGRKRSHWMWYVFPQYKGLGFSSTSRYYAINSLEEARAYLAHPMLGPRLSRIAHALLEIEGQSAHAIFGYPDDLKLHSSLTLFAAVSPPGSIFEQLQDKYFGGQPDENTLRLIDREVKKSLT